MVRKGFIKRDCDFIFRRSRMQLKERLSIVLLMSISFYLIIYRLILKDVDFEWVSLFVINISFILGTEVIFLFDRLIDKKYPWHQELKKRLYLLVVFSISWLLLFRFLVSSIETAFIYQVIHDSETYNLVFVVGVLFMIIYVTITIARNHHNSLVYFMLENEALKKEKIENDYKQLSDQLNPHFLFNNLSTLIAIIRSDQKMAITFAEDFTDVYRYVLSNSSKDVASLSEELAFLNAYINLHKTRIGEGLTVTFNIEESVKHFKVPYLSLQILVENAIKHNITSKSKPLSITISTNNNCIVVENTKQLKESTYSTKTGLNNLNQRLSILKGEELEVEETDSIFKVSIPLIQ